MDVGHGRPLPPTPPACTPAMDVFSLGCTLAELFLDGQALFTYSRVGWCGEGNVEAGVCSTGGTGPCSRCSGDPAGILRAIFLDRTFLALMTRPYSVAGLISISTGLLVPLSPPNTLTTTSPPTPPTHKTQLLAYRAGSFDPGPSLDRMPPGVQDLVAHMLQRDPAARAGAQAYLDGELGRRAFPAWMGDVVHPFFASMLRAPPDERVALACAELPAVHAQLAGGVGGKEVGLWLCVGCIGVSMAMLWVSRYHRQGHGRRGEGLFFGQFAHGKHHECELGLCLSTHPVLQAGTCPTRLGAA